MNPTKLVFVFFLLLQGNMFCSYINIFCVAVSLLHFQSLVCCPFSLHSLDYMYDLLWALNDLPLNSVTFLYLYFFEGHFAFCIFSLPRLCSLPTLCHIFTPLLFLGEHQLANFDSPLSKFAVVFCDFSSSYLSIFLSKCQVLFSVSFFSFFLFFPLSFLSSSFFKLTTFCGGNQRTPP